MFLLFQFRHVKQTQVAFTPLCWLIFLITSTFASMFSVYQKRRSTREWHLPIVIMEGKNLMDRESCLSTVRELRCLIKGTWVSSIATSTLRSQLIKIPIASYKYKLLSQGLELRWKKKLRCPLWASIATEAAKLHWKMLKFHVTFPKCSYSRQVQLILGTRWVFLQTWPLLKWPFLFTEPRTAPTWHHLPPKIQRT